MRLLQAFYSPTIYWRLLAGSNARHDGVRQLRAPQWILYHIGNTIQSLILSFTPKRQKHM